MMSHLLSTILTYERRIRLQMKPTQQLLKEVPDRKREVKITEEMEDERIWLLKDWTRYQGARHLEELK